MAVKQYSYVKHGNIELSPHFKVKEFRCKDGTDTILIDTDLIIVLERIYTAFSCLKINITSGYRTPSHDKKVGGRGGGNHCEGKAADFMAYDQRGNPIPSSKIALYLEDIGMLGIGYRCGGNAYATHLDVNYRTNKWFGDEKISMTKSIWNIKSGCYSFYDYLGVKKATQPDTAATASIPAAVKYKVICNSLRVRKGAGIAYGTVRYLSRGITVNVTEINGNWGKIGANQWISIKPAYVKRV